MKKNFLKKAVKTCAWTLLSGLSGRSHSWLPVLAGPARGSWLHLDLRSQSSYFLGSYDRWIYERVPFQRILTAGEAAWDCGAFVGYYAAIFRKLVGKQGEVLVFEASLANYEALKPMPERNGWVNVKIFHEAVGPEETVLTFANNRGGGSGPIGLGKSFDLTEGKLEKIQVKSLGIDEILKTRASRNPRLLKLDLETGEIHALKNGAKVFGEIRPVVMLELHGEEAGDVANEWLQKYEYMGVVIETLPKWKGLAQEQYSEAYRGLAKKLGNNVRANGYLPHMLFCVPKEKGLNA
jgi:FkbM family methyltransferase